MLTEGFTDRFRLERVSRDALFVTASLLLSLSYAVGKLLVDPQITHATGVRGDTVVVLAVALSGWAVLTSLAGVPIATCVLTVLPLPMAFYGIRFFDSIRWSSGPVPDQLTFVAVLVFGTTAFAVSVSFLSGVAVRRIAGSSLRSSE
ncbi:hypothetical protein SAMN05216559_0873 [Halomicrobium zhouii]|uniref:Uncharacterized protein n=1 Tax=Halomicrobium zhouii TaxID=767519 RepID=A0A1I6KIK8_9EURY|nr:hypothetical protein [Halomicrobium zhouii]SFR91063.1 hypothetical protein SAMN05216559_0873 [Halomicrobium zhouii]